MVLLRKGAKYGSINNNLKNIIDRIEVFLLITKEKSLK